ncbi:MAG: exo-alpha-sialidase [Deferribacteres bacterium]|nr:exo-alpha-sialidase [candidate division KSB1 bacterium]MCB9503455.1 exo-alpha-sialidase [Deferribacteres bacterium]
MTIKIRSLVPSLFFLFMPYFLFAQSNLVTESIFPTQSKHVHSSSIVECANGDLLVCWFYGSGERTADDVLIQGSRLKKGAKKWEAVFEMADTPDFPDCNPVLFIDASDKLWLFWIVVQANRWEHSVLKYKTSTDYMKPGAPTWLWQDVLHLKPGDVFAKTVKENFHKWADEGMWAEYAPAYTEMLIEAAKDPIKRETGWMTRCHPTVLPGGRILLPLYSDGYCLGLTAISDDGGSTWRASQPMVGLGLNQPTIVRKNNGTLVAYLRDEGVLPQRVLRSTSSDNGETWSYAFDTDIPNPASSLEVVALKSGNWLMVYNDTEDGRHSLAAALSNDEGQTWKWKKHLALTEKDKASFSYPSLVQTKDGFLHVTYSYSDGENKTIKHAVFDEQWLKMK